MPWYLSPKLRRASASRTQDRTFTDSSPVLVATTSPVAPIQSPSDRRLKPVEVLGPGRPGEQLDGAGRVPQGAEGHLALLSAQHEPAGHGHVDAGLRLRGQAPKRPSRLGGRGRAVEPVGDGRMVGHRAISPCSVRR